MLTNDDHDLIFALARKWVGTFQEGLHRHPILIANVERRMEALGLKSFQSYLSRVEQSATERRHFVSALTIHTTRFFREKWHFDDLRQRALQHAQGGSKKSGPFRFWSAACSSGQELYSAAFVLEEVRQSQAGFDYRLMGSDIDPISLENARKAVYPIKMLSEIADNFHKFILPGRKQVSHLFAISAPILERCSFQVHNLLNQINLQNNFQQIFCRNVLIYFEQDAIKKITKNLFQSLDQGGVLTLGHCEHLNHLDEGIEAGKHSCYFKTEKSKIQPRLAEGAQINVLKYSDVKMRPHGGRPDAILLGASTGGTEALIQMMAGLPATSPPIVVVQHIGPAFLEIFAQRLAECSNLKLGNFRSGEVLQAGTLYMALTQTHISIKQSGNLLKIFPVNGPARHGQIPSVDILFESAAKTRSHFLAFLLTGMGRDGAEGLALLRKLGAHTCAQNEDSSAVFGMPKEAIALNAAQSIGDLSSLRKILLENCLKTEEPKYA